MATKTLTPSTQTDSALRIHRDIRQEFDRPALGAVAATAGTAPDIRPSRALARRLLAGYTRPPEADVTCAAIAALSFDLSPNWDSDWAIVEAEAWRQLRVQALEALAGKLTISGRFRDAAEAARAAITADPLRESAHAALISVYAAAGHHANASEAFETYRVLLQRELGLVPTQRLLALVPAIDVVGPDATSVLRSGDFLLSASGRRGSGELSARPHAPGGDVPPG